MAGSERRGRPARGARRRGSRWGPRLPAGDAAAVKDPSGRTDGRRKEKERASPALGVSAASWNYARFNSTSD